MWQVDFAAAPSVLEDLKHLLKVVAAALPYNLLIKTRSLWHGDEAVENDKGAWLVVINSGVIHLQVDDRIIRYVVLKREPFKPLPTTYRIARMAERKMAGLQR